MLLSGISADNSEHTEDSQHARGLNKNSAEVFVTLRLRQCAPPDPGIAPVIATTANDPYS
jgi:hypothetical protein